MSSVVFLGFKLLTERKRQVIVSILGVGIGVAAFIVLTAMMEGFHKYFTELAVDVNSHITLNTKRIDEKDKILKLAYGDEIVAYVLGSKPKVRRDKIIGYWTIIEKYQKHPEILGIAPHLTGQAIIRYGTQEKSVSILGIESELEKKASVIEKFLEPGDLERLTTDRNSVIIGKIAATDLGLLEKGKKVNLIAPNGTVHLLKVVGFLDSGITTIDDIRAYISLRTFQKILNRTNEVNELIFKIKDVNKAERLAKIIRKETGYYTESWQFAFKNFLELFEMRRLITDSIVFAILLVSGFGIFNIMMMTALEKKRDIAILRAMGYESGEIIKIFVFQGALIGIVGGIMGCILGYLLREWMASIEFEMETIIKVKGFVMDEDPIYFAYGLIFAIVTSFLASFYPSYKASKLYPVDIFRSGG